MGPRQHPAAADQPDSLGARRSLEQSDCSGGQYLCGRLLRSRLRSSERLADDPLNLTERIDHNYFGSFFSSSALNVDSLGFLGQVKLERASNDSIQSSSTLRSSARPRSIWATSAVP